MIQMQVNGKEVMMPEGSTVSSLVDGIGRDRRGIAVAVNETVVPRCGGVPDASMSWAMMPVVLLLLTLVFGSAISTRPNRTSSMSSRTWRDDGTVGSLLTAISTI